MGGQLLADNIINPEQDREGPAITQPGKGGFADGAVIAIQRQRVELAANDGPGKTILSIGENQPRQDVTAAPGKVEYQPISVAPVERQPISFEVPGKSAPARIDISDTMPGKSPAALEDVAIPNGISASRVDVVSILSGKNGFDGLGDERQPISASPGKVEYQPISVAPPERQPISVDMPGKSAPERVDVSDTAPGKSTFSVTSEIRTEPAATLPGKGAANDSNYDNVIRVDPAVFTSGKNDFSQTAPPAAAGPKALEAIGFTLADISSSMSTGNGGGLLSKLNASMGGTPPQQVAAAPSALDDLANGSGNGRFDQSVYERAKAAMKTSGPVA